MSEGGPRRGTAIVGLGLAASGAYLVLMTALGGDTLDPARVLNLAFSSLLLPAFIVASVGLVPPRLRPWVGPSIGSAFGLLGAVHLMHLKYFQAPPHLKGLLHLRELPEVMPMVPAQLLGWRLPTFLALVVAASGIAAVLPPLCRRRAALVMLGWVVALTANIALQDRLYRRLGPVAPERLWVYDVREALATFGLIPYWWGEVSRELDRRRHPLPSRHPGRIGAAEAPAPTEPAGWNLVMLQLESVDPGVVDLRISGRPVMPHLQRLAGRSLRFDRFFAQHAGGGSADTELATLTSLLPLSTHSGLVTARWDAIAPLPRLLAEHGYATAAFHANRASYFNRELSFPKLGFERFHAEPDFEPPGAGWDALDRAFLEQSVAKLAQLPEPFFAYIITLQGHGPFRNHAPHPELDPGAEHPELWRDYVQTMAEVDEGIGSLLAGLAGLGISDRTVVAVFSDHLSTAGDDRTLGKERVFLSILHPEVAPGPARKIGSHLDLAPTMAHLLGIPEPDPWLGESLLLPGTGEALFNDLTVIRDRGGELVAERWDDAMKFLVYSAYCLER